MSQVAWSLVRALLLCSALGCTGTSSRSLHCEQERSARKREICDVIADHLKLSWGVGERASLTPAYLLGARALPKVYCELKLGAADLTVLQSMQSDERDARLAAASGELLLLLAPPADAAHSRYHPSHPQYLLKGGCPVRFSARR
jgi:hypothetical protein